MKPENREEWIVLREEYFREREEHIQRLIKVEYVRSGKEVQRAEG